MAVPNRVVAGGVLAAVVAIATPITMRWEGYADRPYNDMAQGIRSWCYGETSGTPKAHYTPAECGELLNKSLIKHAKPILACLPEAMPIKSQAAMVVLGYNIGVTAVCNSTAAKRARAGDYAGACEAIERFNKARVKGQLVVVRGLARRRADERALCEQGLKAS